MFKYRSSLILAVLSMLLVTLALSQPFAKVLKTVELGQPRKHLSIPVTSAGNQPYIMDSATRSYIAQGEALRAAGKLHASETCSNFIKENISKKIDPNLDSATRSYIALGLALQAKDNTEASCR
jgi:hypothetical protein